MDESFTDHAAHLGHLFAAVGSAELSKKMASCTRDQKVVVRTCYFSGVLVLLRRAGIGDSSLFVLCYRETLSAGLLNSLKKQEVYVIV